MAKITVDWDRCIHSGMCTTIADRAFAMGPDARLVVVREQVDDTEELELVQDAAACCPVEAIVVDE